MPKLHPARLALALAVAAFAAGAAALPAAWARPRPPEVIVPPPPAPTMPGVTLGETFVRDAAAFEDYMRGAAAVSPNFSDGPGVDSSLRVGVAYEPGQLRRGAVAYAAIQVLDDPAFVADVRAAGATPQARYALVARIFANPANALAFAHGAEAAGIAKAALAGAGMQVFNAGDAVTGAAYSMQHQAWSLAEAPDRDGRGAQVRTLSSTQRLPTSDEMAQLEREVAGDPAAASAPAPGPYSPLVVRAVALATLAAIGQAGDDMASNLHWLTDDYFMDHCLSETKLALYECLAVARPNYENAFCLGQHAMKDTGSCVVRAAGATVPADIPVLPGPRIPPAHIGARRVTHRRS
jgi:hypothetical protein